MFDFSALDRTPRQKWKFEDNKLTGVIAYTVNPMFPPSLILPYGLSDEQRDLILWAFETGLHQGDRLGRESMQRDFKRLLDIKP